MQRILSTHTKLLDFLLQEATPYLKPEPKDVYLKESKLLYSVSRASRYQILIPPSRPAAFKVRILSYRLIIITALTGVICLLVLDGLISIIVLMLKNYKASGKDGICVIIDK